MNARLLLSVTDDAEHIYRERFIRERYGIDPVLVAASPSSEESEVVDFAEILEEDITEVDERDDRAIEGRGPHSLP
jgi:hypothetical protein